MNIYRLSQDINHDMHDFHCSSCIVSAQTEDDARYMHPAGKDEVIWYSDNWYRLRQYGIPLTVENMPNLLLLGNAVVKDTRWVHPSEVTVEHIGVMNTTRTEPMVLLASFHGYN